MVSYRTHNPELRFESDTRYAGWPKVGTEAVNLPSLRHGQFDSVNRYMKTLAGLVLSLLLVTGCATSESTRPTPSPVATPTVNVDETFLSVLRDNVPGTTQVPDEDLLSLAQSICSSLRNGASVLEVARVGVDSGLTAWDSGYIVGASVAAYCNDQEYKIRDFPDASSV